ncbi:ATP-binding protein/SpoIIE family protein phosphatase [Xenophilus arseniciresistens]|uniref:ATP-binding protein/SpoIIE family protein phosphatase n=1 Tax=Xenophilus arseniciresistens TaxID=1283306 RepID=A0AAE3SYS6_9BURK|nr:ATP-binding SpoIIE family protein phosphatase [Xenophilus arseniciresistens]MDA7416417.1 ATP-binding protein/SpoIIE family protein phosphatase [Xenophilus arseniciresistens]
MEVIRGWTHRAFEISDLSCVGEARRHASGLALARGWSEVDRERTAIVVTELATNLAKHARAGELLIAARDALADIEVVAVDAGPGMADVPRAMRDGFSTSATPGTGLGAIQRQADAFELHSAPASGTVCVARLRPRKSGTEAAPPPSAPWRRHFGLGAICVPMKGETACGDGWSVAFDGTRAAALVADGLGHGPDAALASTAALESFGNAPFEAPARLIRQMHEALRSTRGAAVFGLWMDAHALHYAGAGNVAGRLVSGISEKSLATAHGTLGLQARSFEATTLPYPAHAAALLHSDGLRSRWPSEALAPLLRRDPTLMAARLYADHSRRRDDACVLVLRPQEPAP